MAYGNRPKVKSNWGPTSSPRAPQFRPQPADIRTVLLFAVLIPGFDLTTASLFAGAFAPALVLIAAVAFDNLRTRKAIKPPQEEKLLRPPGHSLSVRLDTLMERGTTQLVWAMFWTAWAGVLGGYIARQLSQDAPFLSILFPVLILIATVLAGTALAIRAYRTLQERRQVRLGLRGEQATAEALAEASDAGFRIFHDIQAGDDWNIDHVAVGPKGLFLIETKARTRFGCCNGEPEHHVKFDGTTLEFPGGIDRDSVSQARRNAGWLNTFLIKKTGESIPVDTIVVVPGWWVDGRGDSIKAMNCKHLTKYLRTQPDRLAADQAERITAALDEKNRDLDFI